MHNFPLVVSLKVKKSLFAFDFFYILTITYLTEHI